MWVGLVDWSHGKGEAQGLRGGLPLLEPGSKGQVGDTRRRECSRVIDQPAWDRGHPCGPTHVEEPLLTDRGSSGGQRAAGITPGSEAQEGEGGDRWDTESCQVSPSQGLLRWPWRWRDMDGQVPVSKAGNTLTTIQA